MRIAIDCEFNGHGGDLISMALVTEDGQEWYRVLHCSNPTKWVEQHVMSRLGMNPVPLKDFQESLKSFLNEFKRAHVIADWPEDIKYFCEALIVRPGVRMKTPPLSFEIKDIAAPSDVPHNALHDARGIAKELFESK